MRIEPTVSGDLKLVPANDLDWYVLLKVGIDAEYDLASELAGLMDEDAMWDEIVMPELADEFSKQRSVVRNQVMEAKQAALEVGEEAEIVIDSEQAESWYGVFNQARLGLEQKYKFGQGDDREPDDIENIKERDAYYRTRFYSYVQESLLDFVMSRS